jgi:hypothetical protein
VYLVTHSLHSAWRWYKDSETSTKQEFLDTLNKVEKEPTEAMLAGRQFEEDVEAACRDKEMEPDHYSKCVFEVADQVRGGLWQEKVYSEARLGGTSILLYGKADVVRRNWIYDIKRTANYDIGKYTSSIQHALYMHCSGIHNFRYLISDGRSVWHEDYRFDEAMEANMFGEIAQMLECILGDPEFSAAYQANWLSRPKVAA